MITYDELPEPNRSGDHVLQENTTNTSELANVPLTGADKVAYAFYATAAMAALVGQVWAGVTHIPWPEDGFPVWLRIAVVTPAVAVIELGGVATAALADLRRRKGEQAYAYRAMSLFAALVALVFNVVGHWRPEERFLAFGFGGLSAFAYVLWLIHSSARRRDALRRAGQMARTGPVYGLVQWTREPKVTWLARSLALEHGYGLYESLRHAREQIRTTARRVAIAGTVAEFIRSEQKDERLAKIAETTYDPDKLAAMLEERVNYETVTARLTRAIAPAPDNPDEERADLRAAVWVVEGTTPPAEVGPSGGGVPLRGANDRWSEKIGELTAAEYLPYDRSSDEPNLVVEADEPAHTDNAEASAAQAPAVPAQVAPAQMVPSPSEHAPAPVAQAPGLQTPAPAAQADAGSAAEFAVAEPWPASAPSSVAAAAPTRGPVPAAAPVAASVPVQPEEPEVVARKVASRTRSASGSTGSGSTASRSTASGLTASGSTASGFTGSGSTGSGSAASAPAAAGPNERVMSSPAEPAASPSSRPARSDRPAARDEVRPEPAGAAGGQDRDTDKKKMRAWALLSDWPADRKRDAATLASAIATNETHAAQLIKLYDEEHGDRTLVGSQHWQG